MAFPLNWKLARPLRCGLIGLALASPLILLAADEPKPKSSPASTERPAKDQRSAYADLPKERLQRQAEKLSDKRDVIQSEIDDLSEYLARTKAAQEALARAQPENLESQIKKVADALVAMAALPPATPVINQLTSPGGALNSALIALNNDAENPVLEIVRPVLPAVRPVTGGSRVLGRAEQVADECAGRFSDPRQSVFLVSQIPDLLSLVNHFSFPQPGSGSAPGNAVKRGDLEKEIVAAQAETKDLPNRTKKFFEEFRKQYVPILEAVAKCLQEANDARKAEAASLNQQLSEIDKEQSARAENVDKRQGTLTNNLIYTEVLMILAIIAAMFYLRFYSERLAITMVQERTLGDLLGMGLLLVTIIFLATGEFVDKSALVTLLGTIAGYIFARRSGGAASRDESSAAAALPAPKNLKQVLPAVPGQISLTCDPVKAATGYRWYTRPQGGHGDFTLRKQTSEPRVTMEGFQTGDKLDATVSASNGQEGKQSAPLSVTVT